MHRSARSRLSPWIESLILSYDGPEESGGGGRLKAHVIGVGPMSQSQALGAEGPSGLLFLSDGLLQIPAILTASAWEHLQEQEDRECFTSLVNATVCIQDYRLQFHMAPEQTRSRFVLSVGELATTAAGPVKDGTPCSTTLPSVRAKICTTWRALLGQETQDSQRGVDLSELLGEWQHDCLQAVLDDVRERLAAASRPRPSTSACDPPETRPDAAFLATSWSVDRVRYKGESGFSVPMRRLLIPEEDARQTQTPPGGVSGAAGGLPAAAEDGARDSPPASDTAPPPVDDAPAAVDGERHADETSPHPSEDSMLHEREIGVLIDYDIPSSSSLWDVHLPPCETSSCSGASLPPSPPPQHPAAPGLDRGVMSTSTQLPVHGSTDSQQTSEPSNLPPYQKLPAASSTPASPPEPCTRPPDRLPASDLRLTDTAHRTLPALDAEKKYRKARRKRSQPTPEAEEEDAPIGGSPPSWLFDSQAGPGAEEGGGHRDAAGAASRRRPTAHSDGRLFSYAYELSGRSLQDFSDFRVTESLLHWAVRQLVGPEQGDPVTSTQTDAASL